MSKTLLPLVCLCFCATLSQSLIGDFESNNAFEESGVMEPELSQIKRAKVELIYQIKNYYVRDLKTCYTKDAIYDAAVVFRAMLKVVE